MTKTLVVGLVFAVALLSGCVSMPTLPDKDDLTVYGLVSLVDQAWTKVKADPNNSSFRESKLKLDSVTLTLATKITDTTDQSVSLVVVGDAKQDVTTSQSLTIKLSEPKTSSGKNFRIAGGEAAKHKLVDELVKVIQQAEQAAMQVDEAERADRKDKLPPLSDITASVGFNITNTSNAGVNFQLGSIKVGTSYSRAVSGSHEIDLVFTRQAAKTTALPHDLQWFRKSAEYEASAQTIYNAAIARVPNRCGSAGPAWVAIMDADETIFDNSDQRLDWWEGGKDYDSHEWNTWVSRGQEGLIPGAKDFIEAVAVRCDRIVVVTNRSDRNPAFGVDECQTTKDRLRDLFGYIKPRNPIAAVLCARVGEDGKPDDDKNRRFSDVVKGKVPGLKNVLVGMYIGDSITDFPGMGACPESDALTNMRSKLGLTYFVLPNPTYGKWVGCTKTWRSPARP